MSRHRVYRRYGKRLFDIVLSLAAIAILSPLLIAICIAVRIALGSPIFFRQHRGGLHQRPFSILKFRTMTNARDASGELLRDRDRLTAVGRILRATSLDELPELFSVLKGDMSLVGPRPLLTRYEPWYTPEEARRFDVLPGITGWAQISGRNDLGWEDRFRCDLYYVDNYNFAFDLKILLLTVGKVLRRENVHVDTTVNMLPLDEERGNQLSKTGHLCL